MNHSRHLLTIGGFALVCGLSVPALRHYDEIDLLKPALTDERTNYRYYSKDEIRSVLIEHRQELETISKGLANMTHALDEYIEKGIAMPEVRGSRIAMVNVAVNDLDASQRFYANVFGVEFMEETHHDGPRHLNASFGTWPSDSFFLMQLWPNPERAGTADLGFLVEDLDEAYQRALAAGATDVHGPKDVEGMPRVAQVKDPSGNDIGLYQG
ncbi:MAG: VOC family protein [Actinomycetota bacterium]